MMDKAAAVQLLRMRLDQVDKKVNSALQELLTIRSVMSEVNELCNSLREEIENDARASKDRAASDNTETDEHPGSASTERGCESDSRVEISA
jgi:hypothetical protein